MTNGNGNGNGSQAEQIWFILNELAVSQTRTEQRLNQVLIGLEALRQTAEANTTQITELRTTAEANTLQITELRSTAEAQRESIEAHERRLERLAA
ncbi:hypothetical protein [Leptolyngbya sp. FACHB-261]|uniref:hypothetical protein n=1 Tax=Leptolyngbya sp. FACHB-261 TaxID=2692806 RepID=UPI001688CA45|nr:hypothetical protein [Leptolyngbya sp. FACHB-261]MBD2105205.1 hypothetical protein [Leptolyngbya sp. FACHB-261]